MKSFQQIRELAGRKPTGQMVWSKKFKKIQTMIYKERNDFIAYIDGDRLDRYRTQKDAEKSITQFMKQYKG